MQRPILPIATSSNSNRPTSILPFLDVTKSLIGLCLSSLLTVFTFMMQNYIATGSPPPRSFSVLYVALLFAFSASVCEVLIRPRFPEAAGAMERVALVSIVTAFFMLMFFLLPEDLGWFLLIPFLLVLLPFLHPIFITERRTTNEESMLPREAAVAETGSSTGHSGTHNTRMTPMRRADYEDDEDDADYEATVLEEGQQKGGEDWNVHDVLDN